MSASGDRATGLLDRASNASSLSNILLTGVGAVILSIVRGIVRGVITIADLFIRPLQTLGIVLANLVNALFGGAAQIINVGAISTAISIGPQGAFNFGPATFALGIGSVLLGLFILNRYVSLQTTSNAPIPGLGVDIPYPVLEGPEEEQNR